QVKIRGFRIELGEIERALVSHPSIEDAVVIGKKNQDEESYLVAYYKVENALDEGAIRFHIGSILPSYMIPDYYICLPAFPLNQNGKVDRKALESKSLVNLNEAVDLTATERTLHKIWIEVLEKDNIGVNDNFFKLGGHSLKAMKVLATINDHFVVDIKLSEVFKHPTIKKLAKSIDKRRETAEETQAIVI
ncbi:MAG: acyl carrier protein, partial [Cyclobacteriaceae bacterium]